MSLGLPQPRTWGGRRRGSGRKRSGAIARVGHRTRPAVTRHLPVHVTLRVREHVWNLRSARCHGVIAAALGEARALRVVQYSVQGDHCT